MKIITLLPVKNEAWILPFSLKNFSLFSDEIIILNDKSEDSSLEIIKTFPKVHVIHFDQQEEVVDMSLRRNILLQAGRKSNGTHFVFLDADEIFSENFTKSIKNYLSKMMPGERLLLPWISITESDENLCFEKKERTSYKDFIFCDNKISIFKKQFLSEARTPGEYDNATKILFSEGYVLHFQYLAKKRVQLKQAWYRMSELIKGERSARRINATYEHTKRQGLRHEEILNDSFVKNEIRLIDQNDVPKYYLEEIKMMFEKHGIEFFESLDIWHIDELQKLFIEEVKRHPKHKVFPKWLLFLNTIKNKIKNGILL